ncbi:MAG TPA: phage holin family protein [Myxococcales bacterium]|nr:phage holin family protein [Myxococcales bacterium]
MPGSDPHAEVSPRDALARLLDGVQTLFREHLALAKIELKDDLRRAGRDLLLGAAGLPPLLVGYLLLMVALALLIALALPGWIAFALMALLNLLVGGALTKIYGEKARREKIALPRTDALEARGTDRARSGEPMTAERNEPLRH